MYKHFIVNGHKITADNAFINNLFGLTIAIGSKLDRFSVDNMVDNSEIENELLTQIEIHPEIPQFKNLLATYYLYNDNVSLAYEVNDAIISLHPNFIYASIMKASSYLNGDAIDTVKDILGADFEIEKFAPQRELFFIDEIAAYYKVAAMYFILKHEKESAQKHLSFLQALDPNLPETLFVEHCFEGEFLWDCYEYGLEELDFDEDARRVSPPASVLVPQTTTPPKFANTQVVLLYAHDLELEKSLMKQILSLPRESLIDDMILIIEDSMQRFDYFDKRQKDENDDMNWSYALIHAVFILGELKSERGLDNVLQTLCQSEAYIDLWYGDFLSDVMVVPIFKLAKSDSKPLVEFLKRRNVYTYCKTEVAKALQQIAFHYPKQKIEIENCYAELISYFIENEEDGDLIDSEFLAFMVMDIRDLRLKALSDELEEMFETIYISEDICGSIEEILHEINLPPSKHFKLAMPDILSCYFNFSV